MSLRSPSVRLARLFAAGSLAAGLLLATATADDRLSGYWVPAPDQPDPAVFSIGQLGKWTVMTQHWKGPNDTASELKVRYLVVTDGNRGTLTADQNLDKLPEAPRTITYQIENGKLTLAIADAAHAGTYELVKGTPPARPVPAPMVDLRPPARPAPPVKQVFAWERLLGSWASAPESVTQINLFIGRSKAGDVFKVNQRWVHGSDSPSLSQAGSYAASMQGSQAVLTKDKPDFEGSPIPLVFSFNFEGDNLYLTVNDGPYAGRYQLVHQARNQRNPGE